MSYCINLKQKLNRTLYCKKKKKIININECSSCEFKEYKDQSYPKSYYKPKKGKCGRYYNDISIMPESKLYFTHRVKGCEKHHIFGGVANRPKSEEYGLFVWLTEEQHSYLHSHPLEMVKLKKLAQSAFIKKYKKAKEEFIIIFGRNYL